jgi:threonine/homoserine/homoserine lactone efflux protein|tara:strand:- start:466 stop:1116 length:651 start_codon:yes stop_codon:yes gene_type:complete
VLSYWSEFLTIALIHLFAVASPGPDFAVVSRYSLSFGRKAGYWVSLGIAAGIVIHVTYSLVGVALIIHQTDWLYQTLLCAGALYLGFIGTQAIKAKPRKDMSDSELASTQPRKRKAFIVGFITNGLNVKATIFFLTLFTTIIAPETPFSIQFGYGVYLIVATGLWFLFLTWLLTQPRIFKTLWHYSHWVDRTMGAALILLSLKLLWEWANLIELIG